MRHYTVKEFFRQVPNALLARYFEHRGVFNRFDFEQLAETEPDTLIEAWLLLPDNQRRAMDADLQEIFALADEGGFQASSTKRTGISRRKPPSVRLSSSTCLPSLVTLSAR